jgi:hypothetical protein
MALEYVGISSYYTRKRDTLDRERLAASKCRKRNHPKRHGVGEEKSQIAKRKHAKAVRKAEEWLDSRNAHVAKVRLYWRGLADHP